MALVSYFTLQASVYQLVSVLLAGAFMGVLDIVAHPALVDYLLRSHHQDAAGEVTMSVSAFSLRKKASMLNQNLHLCHTC